MIPLWLTGAAQGITSLLGTPEQQRARQDKLVAAEIERLYREAQLGLQRETLAETRRQHDLQYGPMDITLPTGEKVTGPRYAIPALIQAAAAREREVSPQELGMLGTIRERIVNPKVGGAADLEAEATAKAFPQFAKEVTGLNVDLPQDLRLPRTSVEKLFTEAGQQRKELEGERRANLQRQSTARYRELYSSARSQNVPHALADALAIRGATQEFGVAPEYQGLVPAPVERPEPKMSLEDEYLVIKKAKPTGPYTPYEDLVIKQYDTQRAKRERGATPFDAAIELAGGDLGKALEIYRRDPERLREATERRASFILEESRRQVTAARTRIEAINQTPEQFNALVQKAAKQLMQGESPEVQAMVSSMVGLPQPKGGPQAPPPGGGGRAATRVEVENAKRQAGGDPQKARQLLIQQGINPTLPLVE